MSKRGAPPGRSGFGSVWTGRHLVVWGGYRDAVHPEARYPASGHAYDPRTDSWQELDAPVSMRAEGRVGGVLAATGDLVWLCGGVTAGPASADHVIVLGGLWCIGAARSARVVTSK